MNINETFKEYAQYLMMQKELEKKINAIKSEITQYMTANQQTELIGDEHKAILSTFSRSSFDTKAFKAADPKTFEKFSKSSVVTSLKFN